MIMNKYYLKLTSFVALFAMCVALMPANAGGVTLTPGDAEIDSGDVTAGFAEVTASWTSASDYAASDIIRVSVTWSNTTGIPQHGSSTNLGQCAAATVFDGGATYGTMTSDSAEIILSAPLASGNSADICVRVPVQDGADLYTANFSLSILTSNADADYGATEFYVNGGNDVLVDASVQPTLEFAIVDSTNATDETHECHLGTLDIGLVSDCDYRLRVSTNAQNGFQVQLASDKQLSTDSYATITDIGVSGTVTAGVEGYGIAVVGASTGGHDGLGVYGEPITVDGSYATADNTVPQSATNFVSFGDAFQGTGALANSTLVTHRAAMDAGTLVGYYQHTVTYTVTATF
jgi:hypothetical protein